MGRQILFYMVGKDEIDFINKVLESGDYFINDIGDRMTLDEITSKICGLWIVSQQSRIVKLPGGRIDDNRIDGIQFHRSLVLGKTLYYNFKNVQPGRLWVQLKYYPANDLLAQPITKGKWVEEKYNGYKRWIIKNTKIDKDKMFYIGKTTYLLNKHEGIKMMQGPKTIIEFD